MCVSRPRHYKQRHTTTTLLYHPIRTPHSDNEGWGGGGGGMDNPLPGIGALGGLGGLGGGNRRE